MLPGVWAMEALMAGCSAASDMSMDSALEYSADNVSADNNR